MSFSGLLYLALERSVHVPDERFLHAVAVEVCAVGRIDFACEGSVVEQLGVLRHLQQRDLGQLHREVHVVRKVVSPELKLKIRGSSETRDPHLMTRSL